MNGTTIYPNMQEIIFKNCTIVNGVDIDDSKVGQVDSRWAYGTWSYGYYGGPGYYDRGYGYDGPGVTIGVGPDRW